MWIQIGGALFFAAIAIAEASGFKSPTFGLPMGWIIFALAAATMAFETWRTCRKMKQD
ncbi:MAG: DUF202 domain-containing protein [Methyloligellaceae bacterium]